MKVYICYDHGRYEEESELLGVFKNKQDSINLCDALNLNQKHSIEEHELIE